ncbi:MAG: DUF3488 and transglutaminase-like domain-containing protein [Acidobacteriota bacterium]|nr:DUF3488 and transglutaminase-like domain-containing protein [Acidobacteriota bacterium]
MSAGVGALRLPRFRWRRKNKARPGSAALTFAREKRQILGVLAFAVALPFPMNEPQPEGVVGMPGLMLYLSVVGFYIWRVAAEREATLPMWAMNILGLAYIPWFFYRLRSVGPAHIAKPMVELLLFGLVVKLFSMRRESEKWHVTVLLFFLFVAAMATSVHPLIIVYLLGFLVLWLALLFRFVHLHLLATYRDAVPARRLGIQPLLAACAMLILAGAIPFFTLLPRLRTPYILGQGINPPRQSYSTGFRDEVSLDVVGNIRQNEAVALRLKPEGSTLKAPRMLRGTTYDTFEHNAWLKSETKSTLLSPAAHNFYRLRDGEVDGKMRVWLEPLDSRSLILPMETLSVEVSQRLLSDVGGGVLISQPRRGILEYRIGIGSRPVYLADSPDLASETEPTLDATSVSPRVRELSELLTADLPKAQVVERIEQYLAHNYAYTLDFLGRETENPIEDFLFKYRSGHCEYFATAMILMLRSVDVPARLVTGFVGAEFNPLEDYYIVRQSNAHAWVEAWIPEVGWATFDPTPPAGRPEIRSPNFGMLVRQAWDYLEFRWDRYVMSYGFFDQIGLLIRMREAWRRFESPFKVPASDPGGRPDGTGPLEWEGIPPQVAEAFRIGVLGLFVASLAIGLVAVSVFRRKFDVTSAYRSLRTAFGRRDPSIGKATAPLALLSWAESHVPHVAEPSGQLIERYLLEIYAGRTVKGSDASSLRRHLRAIRSGLRKGPRGSG